MGRRGDGETGETGRRGDGETRGRGAKSHWSIDRSPSVIDHFPFLIWSVAQPQLRSNPKSRVSDQMENDE
jgi:hypothetical protein